MTGLKKLNQEQINLMI